jgi:hypothetical protein
MFMEYKDHREAEKRCYVTSSFNASLQEFNFL